MGKGERIPAAREGFDPISFIDGSMPSDRGSFIDATHESVAPKIGKESGSLQLEQGPTQEVFLVITCSQTINSI